MGIAQQRPLRIGPAGIAWIKRGSEAGKGQLLHQRHTFKTVLSRFRGIVPRDAPRMCPPQDRQQGLRAWTRRVEAVGCGAGALPLLRWIWDEDDGPDGFAGSIDLRWMQGNASLPPHALGHIGYAVPPWKQGRGHATRALQQLLPLARENGQTLVELTTDLDNEAPHRVIAANGGVRVEQFNKGAADGEKPALRFRIDPV